MGTLTLLCSPLFSGAQLGLIIVISAVLAAVLAVNAVLFALFFKRRKKRKLCSAALQARREQLLEELYNLRFKTPEDFESEEEEDNEAADESDYGGDENDEDEDFDVDDNEDTDSDEAGDDIEDVSDRPSDETESDTTTEPTTDGEAFSGNTEILAVREMSPFMREKLGFVGEEYDRKRYYVRVRQGFEGALRNSPAEVKARYKGVMNEFARYGKQGVKRSFRQERVYYGRKTLAIIMFRGKTLCVALALDPKEYENTKYRGIDKSDKKRFAKTPMLLKLTSARRLKYAVELIEKLAENSGIVMSERTPCKYDLRYKRRNDLYACGQLKIAILGEAPELDISGDAESEYMSRSLKIMAVSDMTPNMRTRFGLIGDAFDGRRYYVRYGYGFEAKLRMSDDEIKSRYLNFVNEVLRYKKLTLRSGFRNVRLCYKRKTVGLILFKGKTLCVAFALDPDVYKNTKYRGKDMSGVKRYQNTPLLIKLSSERRLGYAQYLLNRLAENNMLEMSAHPATLDTVPSQTDIGTMFDAGLLKISVVGEAPKLGGSA